MYYFLSDLHLSETQPDITRHFLQFLREKAPFAQGVYILGDLFDFWIGDDEQSPLIEEVKQALKDLTQQGVPCYFQHGNRDFLIGKGFAKETGVKLLGDYELIERYNKRILLCHGDTLCIDDVKYQQFRKKVHQPLRQWFFLCLPLKFRLHIAQKIRAKSQLDKGTKSAEIMDVNADFTAQIAEKYQADWLVHGHTHRQAVHFCQFFAKKDRLFQRIVLGDWHADRVSILRVDEQGFEILESN